MAQNGRATGILKVYGFNVSLIKSISGIRGTIGGKSGDALTPIDIAKFTLAFGTILKLKDAKKIGVDLEENDPRGQ